MGMYSWQSRNTLYNHRSVSRTLNIFQLELGLQIMDPASLSEHFQQPCTDASISFYWAVLYKSILPSAHAREYIVGFLFLRLMSVVSVSYNTFPRALLVPEHHYQDKTHGLLPSNTIAPQENTTLWLFISGLSVCNGEDFRKSKPLLHRHFLWNQNYREELFLSLMT